MTFWQIMWYALLNPSLVDFRNPWRYITVNDALFILISATPCVLFCFLNSTWIIPIVFYVGLYSLIMISSLSYINGANGGKRPMWTFFVGTPQNLDYEMPLTKNGHFYIFQYMSSFKSCFPNEEIFIKVHSHYNYKTMHEAAEIHQEDRKDIFISATFLNKHTAVQARLTF